MPDNKPPADPSRRSFLKRSIATAAGATGGWAVADSAMNLGNIAQNVRAEADVAASGLPIQDQQNLQRLLSRDTQSSDNAFKRNAGILATTCLAVAVLPRKKTETPEGETLNRREFVSSVTGTAADMAAAGAILRTGFEYGKYDQSARNKNSMADANDKLMQRANEEHEHNKQALTNTGLVASVAGIISFAGRIDSEREQGIFDIMPQGRK